MVLLGDLATDAASLEQFVSSASYVVYLNGLVPQAVTLNDPGPAGERFNHVYINNTTGVSFDADAQIDGFIVVAG